MRFFLTEAISWHCSKTGRIYFKSGTYSSLSVTSVTLWSGIWCIILYRMLQEKEVYIGQPSTCILVSHWLKHFKPAFYILNPSALIPCFVICGVRACCFDNSRMWWIFHDGGRVSGGPPNFDLGTNLFRQKEADRSWILRQLRCTVFNSLWVLSFKCYVYTPLLLIFQL